MRIVYGFALTGILATPAAAAGIDVTVNIPQLRVAEYHRPYVAMWIEKADGTGATTLSVWYDHDKRNNEGNKWLRDVRTWWRKSGRSLTMPADGLSGATKAPGPQRATFNGGPLARLTPGNYVLLVEAARESGGRELVRLPFAWPPRGAAQTVRATGTTELGTVAAVIRP